MVIPNTTLRRRPGLFQLQWSVGFAAIAHRRHRGTRQPDNYSGQALLKVAELSIRNRKDQNGRSGYTGNPQLQYECYQEHRQHFADALLGQFPQL